MENEQYQIYADKLLGLIEDHVEQLDDNYDCDRSGTALTIERFGESNDRNKVVVNLQPFRQEIWLAGPRSAFHFKYKNDVWLDTRDDGDFFKKFLSCLKDLSNF